MTRKSTSKNAYNQRVYKQAKRALKGLPCRYCGTSSDTVEHIIPVSQGGTSTRENLAPACARCNYSRGGRLGAQVANAKRRNAGSTRHWRY